MSGRSGAEVVMALPNGPDGTTGELDRWLLRLLDHGPSRLVVDLSGVDPLSSLAVSALLRIHGQCRSRGVVMVLRQPSRRSRGVLRRAGLLAALPVERAGQAGGAGHPMSEPTVGAPPLLASNRSGSREA